MPKNVSTKPAAKSKYLSSVASYNKGGSRPNSPALTAVGSPSLNPGYGAASRQSMDKAKGQRTMIVHELAAEDRTTSYLEGKWSGPADDFKTTLEKVADYLSASDSWALKKMYWKELDVWRYDYDSQDDRQNAIDRAVKIFDRTRLGLEEAPWEKLLPKEERGKGKHLSRVQANIAKVSASVAAAPKIKVDGASDTGAEDVLKLDGSESVGRSSSQPLPAKKKPAPKLLSAKPKASTPKPMQSKAAKDRTERALPVPAKTGKFLSEEYVIDSDSDSSEKPMASVTAAARNKKASPAPRPAPKPVERPAVSKPKQKAKPVERPVERAKPVPSPQPTKRRREEDEQDAESSSSSGRPLAKRIKPKPAREVERAPIKAPVALKHRPAASDSQGSRGSGTNGSISFKSTKNTSPVKSSPLASSPPTNASDLEQQRRHPPPDPIVGRKRKISADTSDDGLSSKGSTTSSADSSIVAKRRKMIEPALVKKASIFKTRYAKYANLHREISSMDHPPRSKIEDLEHLRDSLARLKAEIYKECPPAIAVA
jgi:RNA polymerase II elongation factor ELL